MMQPGKWYKFIGKPEQVAIEDEERFIIERPFFVFSSDELEFYVSATNDGNDITLICLLEGEQRYFQEINPSWKQKLELKGLDMWTFDSDEEDEWNDDEE